MRIFILVAFLSIFCNHPNAVGQKFTIGARAGILLAYPDFADPSDHRNTTALAKLGFSIDGLIVFPLKMNYSFQVSSGFSQQGRVVTFTSIGTHKNVSTYYFADLAIGLQKKFRLKLNDNISSDCYFLVGPNVNYWINGNGRIETSYGITQKYTIVFDGPPGTRNDKMYIQDENRWLFGLNFGLGFSAATRKNQRIFTEFRLTWGQSYLGKSRSAHWNNLVFQGQESMKFNLKVINVSVGYLFNKDIRNAKKGKTTRPLNKKKTFLWL